MNLCYRCGVNLGGPECGSPQYHNNESDCLKALAIRIGYLESKTIRGPVAEPNPGGNTFSTGETWTLCGKHTMNAYHRMGEACPVCSGEVTG